MKFSFNRPCQRRRCLKMLAHIHIFKHTYGRRRPTYTISSPMSLRLRWAKINACKINKQVAQRATIAHLSPMCQGQSAPKPYAAFPPPQWCYTKFDQDWPTGFRDVQVQKCEIFVTQGQVTPKWVVWFGPKSNSTKIVCLSWLPSTLMMIRSKVNELAWRHHFPIISQWEIF